jgi:hypothetical protein
MTQSKQTRDVNGNAMSYYKRIQNKESVMIVIAISNKRNNMFMINTTYNFHICLKLSLSLSLITSIFQLFYRNHATAVKNVFVTKPKLTYPKRLWLEKSFVAFINSWNVNFFALTTKSEGGLYGGSTLKTNKEVLETKYTIKLTNFYKNSSRTERIK